MRSLVAVLDARDEVAAAVALDLETHLVARTQGLERCRILDGEDARAAFQQELRDRPELQSDPACCASDGDDAPRRERLVGRHSLVAGRLRLVADLRLAGQR